MPKALSDFPRPAQDNGRGLHTSFDPQWKGGTQGYDYWIDALRALGITWCKVVDDKGSSLAFCEKLLAADIFPIVRILRRDPPPNDTPEPNPGHLGAPEEATLRKLVAAGVRYFETNNEPDTALAWKHKAIPGNPIETAKLVALNWLFDARLILSAGGLPGLPAMSSGSAMDLMGALVSLGRQDILLEGCWIAIHNDCRNRPLNYPDDAVNRAGERLTPEQYERGMYTTWAWWNSARERADTLDEINSLRFNGRNPTQTIQQDHACFREFEYYNALAMKYLGRSIPIIGTQGGYVVGRREDTRYPRLTPDAHRDQTIALFDFMQHQAPDYFFAATLGLAIESTGTEVDAWYSAYWQHALTNGSDGRSGIPEMAVPGNRLGNRLPVVDAVQAMPNLPRRLPGAQPAPPVAPQPVSVSASATRPAASSAGASWLRDLPTPIAPSEKPITPAPQPVAPEKIIPPPAPEFVEPAPATPPVVVAPSVNAPPPIFDAPEALAPTSPPAITTPPPPIEMPDAMPVSAELEWDWRLDALQVLLEPAQVASGQAYWKLIGAEYQSPDEANDAHQIFYTVVDERNRSVPYHKVIQSWADEQTDAITNEHGETNIPLWLGYAPERGERGAYTAWVDSLPSDRVSGLGLPAKRHVSFRLTWRRARA